MSQIIVKRPPRTLPAEVPGEEVAVQPPPELPKGQQDGVLMQLMPMLGMGSSVVFFFMPNAHPFMRIMGMLMMVSTGAMVVAMIIRHRRGTQGQMGQLRRDYLRYLARTRRAVWGTARAQRDAQLYLHPAPEQLWALVAEGSRLWERRPGDGDFGQVRLGLGEHGLATPLVPPQTAPVDELEPLTAGAMRRFLATHGTVSGLPMAVSLRGFYQVVLAGDVEAARGTARALVASLTALHSPQDVTVAVACSAGAADAWEWAKWLPHVQLPSVDGAGSRRLIARGVTELEEELTERLEGRGRFSANGKPVLDQPHVVLVLDGVRVPPHSAFASAEGLQGVTVVEVLPGEPEPARGRLSVRCAAGSLRFDAGDGVSFDGEPDQLPVAAAEALARQLAPLRLSTGAEEDEPLLAELDFGDLLGLGDPAAVDVSRTWRPRSAGERLRVPIGVDESGQPVMLDLKEAAQEGMGPHGLCVGATGSGKSELLRTLVLGLAVTHTSETLNFVLADFKGGATFAGMAQLPHVSAVITNLADDLTLVDRMGDSIRGELQRRQELLRAAGNYANLHDYEKARAAGAPLAPLSSLVLVIDEFSELLTAMPDFIDMFIQIGRIGRSLGVHLLLASQRLEEGRLKGLDTYLSYRIGLRTFSAAESRTAIGVPDAYHLPQIPGSGILKSGTEEMVRFKAAYVSGAYREGPAKPAPSGPAPVQRHPVLFTAAPVPVRHAEPDPRTAMAATEPAPQDDALADTVLDVIVRRLEGQGPSAHQVWLPPLDSAATLDELLPELVTTPERGLQARGATGNLVVPLGQVDKPFEQRREVFHRDFSGAGGHMLIVGGPQSGKSTLLRTLITSFALTHTPREVQFYGLDFGGGGLSSLAGLPHVGGIASRLDADRVRRTVSEVAGILARREELFRQRNIDSIATYRRLRAMGELADESWGDVFLVVDGWAAFKQDYDMTLMPTVTDLSTRGLGYGIHVIVTVSRNMDLLGAMRDQLANRLELRLGDTMDSDFDRKVAAAVPTNAPGRGQTPDKLHWMAALPRLHGGRSPDELSEGTAALVKAVQDAWAHPPAPQVRLLPRLLPASDLPRGAAGDPGLAIGVGEEDLRPVFLDFDQEPFLLVFGEGESGKTAALRMLVRQICDRYPPKEARFLVGDYRRSLLGAVPEEYIGTYGTMGPKLSADMKATRGLMENRLPPTDITPQQLRAGRWWEGPVAFVIIDDFDLVATGSNHPLAQLVDLLPYARDTGVRFIIARNSAGVSRAMFDPFLQRLRELGAQGLVLSSNRSEGEVLPGVRARSLPPGRGTLVTRKGGPRLIQVGWHPEE
ncbi:MULTISPECIES: type VII secretion protein EccCa [unclassified Streptomyces]|uniref:type VII secretion protein EccCa n=1 Tax=unclassified Streptomyces TaxID=2593676 RepID=UPI00190854C3|nr:MULTISPECIES: type VII secretion protein EccCa [unclassified Streptomyces]MCU4750079.1 type VII secretion protein EccCa [Streptomyces sp. G-5]QQN76899.1 type VII secretion protein EccCa [Streptomyces sp. XC 2026]